MKKYVYLNGWKESAEYVASLTNIIFVGKVKDGYDFIACYETI